MMLHTHDGNICYSDDAEVKALFHSIQSTASDAGKKDARETCLIAVPENVAKPMADYPKLMDDAPFVPEEEGGSMDFMDGEF